jgi:peptidoglycan/xylan/chitin deacetylase (PgdA/CDA1 family)
MKETLDIKSLLKICGILFLAFLFSNCTSLEENSFSMLHGAVVRGDSTKQKLTFVFTADTFADGADHIRKVLNKHQIKGAFFFTGNFYRNPDFKVSIQNLIEDGHYLGAHSDRHLLLCDWEKRDSLLVTKVEFTTDLKNNYNEMLRFGIGKEQAPYFLPPYEWYNKTIADWTAQNGLQLINMTHGTLSHADYTTPNMPNYRSSSEIFKNILNYETTNPNGLNGFILLIHVGTEPTRKDKFYDRLEGLIKTLQSRGYDLVALEELLAKG